MISDSVSDSFVLGTVQIGLAYGAVNKTGTPADGEALLAEATASGIRLLDTAQAYGTSEQTIGSVLSEHPDYSFGLVSKVHPEISFRDEGRVYKSIQESRDRLGQPLYGLMYHDPDAIFQWGQAGRALLKSRDAGLAERIGVSVYTPSQFAAAVGEADVTIIQAPFNLLDRRLETSGLLAAALGKGCEVHLRSLFLQGLILTKPVNIPEHLGFLVPWVEKLRAIAERFDCSVSELCIGYVRRRFPGVKLVIGCDDKRQLRSNIELFKINMISDGAAEAVSELPEPPDIIVNPSAWPRSTL